MAGIGSWILKKAGNLFNRKDKEDTADKVDEIKQSKTESPITDTDKTSSKIPRGLTNQVNKSDTQDDRLKDISHDLDESKTNLRVNKNLNQKVQFESKLSTQLSDRLTNILNKYTSEVVSKQSTKANESVDKTTTTTSEVKSDKVILDADSIHVSSEKLNSIEQLLKTQNVLLSDTNKILASQSKVEAEKVKSNLVREQLRVRDLRDEYTKESSANNAKKKTDKSNSSKFEKYLDKQEEAHIDQVRGSDGTKLGLLGKLGLALGLGALLTSGLRKHRTTEPNEYGYVPYESNDAAADIATRVEENAVKGFGRRLFKNAGIKIGTEAAESATKSEAKGVGKLISRIVGRFSKRLGPKAAGALEKGLGIFSKGILKDTAKAAGKSSVKKIPIVGLILGVGDALYRGFREKDPLGAVISLISGIASTIPGIGTAASLAIDALDIGRQIYLADRAVHASNEIDQLLEKAEQDGIYTPGDNSMISQMLRSFDNDTHRLSASQQIQMKDILKAAYELDKSEKELIDMQNQLTLDEYNRKKAEINKKKREFKKGYEMSDKDIKIDKNLEQFYYNSCYNALLNYGVDSKQYKDATNLYKDKTGKVFDPYPIINNEDPEADYVKNVVVPALEKAGSGKAFEESEIGKQIINTYTNKFGIRPNVKGSWCSKAGVSYEPAESAVQEPSATNTEVSSKETPEVKQNSVNKTTEPKSTDTRISSDKYNVIGEATVTATPIEPKGTKVEKPKPSTTDTEVTNINTEQSTPTIDTAPIDVVPENKKSSGLFKGYKKGSKEQKKKFISILSPAIQSKLKREGKSPDFADLMISQMAVESNWGASEAGAFNLSGMKAPKTKGNPKDPSHAVALTTTEYFTDNDKSKHSFPEVFSIDWDSKKGKYKWIVKDWFKSYDSLSNYLDDYYDLINRKWQAFDGEPTVDDFVTRLSTNYGKGKYFTADPEKYKSGVNNRLNEIRSLQDLKESVTQPIKSEITLTSIPKGSFNVDSALTTLEENTDKVLGETKITKKHGWKVGENKPQNKSNGLCARHTRLAINAGGVSTPNNPTSAEGYTTYLPKIGFNEIPNDTELKPGDVSIEEATGTNKNTYGHAAMWDGNQWVSDFKQSSRNVHGSDSGTMHLFRHPKAVANNWTSKTTTVKAEVEPINNIPESKDEGNGAPSNNDNNITQTNTPQPIISQPVTNNNINVVNNYISKNSALMAEVN